MSTRKTSTVNIASAIVLLALPLLACKLGKKKEESSVSPVPTTASTATATATSTAAATDSWQKLKTAGDFEITGPKKFEKTSQTTPSAIGSIETTIYTASLGTTA